MEDVFVMIVTILMIVVLVFTVRHAYRNLPMEQGIKVLLCIAIVFFNWTGILAYWIYFLFVHKNKQMPENKAPDLQNKAPRKPLIIEESSKINSSDGAMGEVKMDQNQKTPN